MATTVCLYICQTCTGDAAEGARTAAEIDAAGDPRPGALLLEAVTAAAVGTDLSVQGVKCLSNCETGCSAALVQPGKWGYLLGRLTPDHAADLVAYARAYAEKPTGTVMPSKRPDSLRDVIQGRVPVPRQDGGPDAFLPTPASTPPPTPAAQG